MLPAIIYAASDQNAFLLISTAGRTLGKATYSISKYKDGYEVRSYYSYKALPSDLPSTNNAHPSQDNPSAGSEAQMSLDYKVAANGDLLDGYMENQANGLKTSFAINRQHALEVSSVQSGVQGLVNTVNMPSPDFVLLPIYDPAALQILLTAVQSQNRPDGAYLLAVPNSQGATPLLVHVQSGPEAAGTLNAQPCPLRQYLLQFGGSHAGAPAPQAQLYVNSEGRLMEADLRPFGVRYVRAKFLLQQN